jgi:S-(hydroxymethyl)glutathione dehydrogenase/alcohol dehydrogenase
MHVLQFGVFVLQELSLDEFISHELSFQEINKAFELLEEGKSLRCIIWMDN